MVRRYEFMDSGRNIIPVNDCPMIPRKHLFTQCLIQRTGDLCWAAEYQKSRGFLVGGTSGRTTLNGEGLQHQDGHAHIFANTIPNLCFL